MAQFTVKVGEQLHQVVPCLLRGEGGGGFPHGGEQVVPRQTLFVAQGFCLGLQIPAELGQVLLDGGEHGVQSGPLHVGLLQGSLQGGVVAAQAALVDGLQLDGVQGVGHRSLDGVVGSQFRIESIPAHLGIGAVGQIPHGGKVGGFSPIGHRHGAGEVLLHLAPGVAAGELQLGHDALSHPGEQVAAGVCQIFQQEAVLAEEIVPGDQRLQIVDPGGPVFKGGNGRGALAVKPQNPAQLGAGLGIQGVGGLLQLGETRQLHHIPGQRLLQLQPPAQPLGGVSFTQCFYKGFQLVQGALQRLHIPGKGRVVKPLIDGVQVPYFVHFGFLLWVVITLIVHHKTGFVNQTGAVRHPST